MGYVVDSCSFTVLVKGDGAILDIARVQ